MSIEHLYQVVRKSIGNKPLDKAFRIKEIHSSLINDDVVREILEIENPIIEDVSNILELSQGKVFAVRQDKAYGITGFKKPVIASLILKRLIESAKHEEINKKWIDGGNVNSSLALAYFAKKFKGEACYIMSRFFPDYVLDYIKDISQNSIEIIRAPDLKLGVERDFYQYLLSLIRKDKKFKDFQPLWHAKYGGEYTDFLGNDLIKSLSFVPDYIVLVLGAGSTLEGQAIPIKVNYKNHPKIIIPEHIDSTLLHKINPNINILNHSQDNSKYKSDWFVRPPKGIPHTVIGPHYDEINPLLNKSVINEIDSVYLYGETDWKEMSLRSYSNHLEVGNSSAANLFVSKQLAEKGFKVLTFIYEPFRDIYRGHNTKIEEEKLNSTSSKSKTNRTHSRPSEIK